MKQNCIQYRFEVKFGDPDNATVLQQAVLAGNLSDAWLHISVYAAGLQDCHSVQLLKSRDVTITVGPRQCTT